MRRLSPAAFSHFETSHFKFERKTTIQNFTLRFIQNNFSTESVECYICQWARTSVRGWNFSACASPIGPTRWVFWVEACRFVWRRVLVGRKWRCTQKISFQVFKKKFHCAHACNCLPRTRQSARARRVFRLGGCRLVWRRVLVGLYVGGYFPFSYQENGSIKIARSLGVRVAGGKPKWSLWWITGKWLSHIFNRGLKHWKMIGKWFYPRTEPSGLLALGGHCIQEMQILDWKMVWHGL